MLHINGFSIGPDVAALYQNAALDSDLAAGDACNSALLTECQVTAYSFG